MFLRSASSIERRKEPFVHRKEQSLESLTQKLKEIIAIWKGYFKKLCISTNTFETVVDFGNMATMSFA